MANEVRVKKKFYKRWWFIALVIFTVIGAIGASGEDAPKEPKKEVIASPVEEVKNTEPVVEKAPVEEKVAEPVAVVEEVVVEGPKETLSQKNAVGKAKDYIKMMAFSESGLITQLEFEGFEKEDAAYGVSQIDVDWKEQAAKKGQDYLDIMSYSKSGLIDQLKFEGFSDEEADYAVNKIGF